MEIHLQVGRRHLAVLAAIGAAVVAGVGYAVIPDTSSLHANCARTGRSGYRPVAVERAALGVYSEET